MEVRLANRRQWVLTAVYASPQENIFQFLWEKLDALEMGVPWLLIGDFNCVLRVEERNSKIRASSSFRSWVDRNELIDLGFMESCYTWSHGTSIKNRKAARLDRALYYDEWRR